jgi:hypothetical protein
MTKSTAWIFPLYFQLPYLPEETCFQQAGSSVVEGTSRALLGPSPVYLQPPHYYLSSQDTNYIILRNVHIFLKRFFFKKTKKKKFVKENEETFRMFLNVLLFHWESSM